MTYQNTGAEDPHLKWNGKLEGYLQDFKEFLDDNPEIAERLRKQAEAQHQRLSD
jgi:hypothetical protein